MAKRKVGELFGKPIVQGGGDNTLTVNEIEIKENNNKYILNKRDSGNIKTLTGNASALNLEDLDWYILNENLKYLQEGIYMGTLVVSEYSISLFPLILKGNSDFSGLHIYIGFKYPLFLFNDKGNYDSFNSMEELVRYIYDALNATEEADNALSLVNSCRVPYSEVKPYIK